MDRSQLTICSYNIHGFNDTKLEYINKLLSKCDILVVQEHWLSVQGLERFSTLFHDSTVYSVSAMDSSILLQGRPYGGCAVIVMNYMYNNNKITLIDTLSPRNCCINISINKCSLYLFCCYMPCDNNSVACLQTYDAKHGYLGLLPFYEI